MTYRVRNIVIAVGLAALAAALTSFYLSSYKKSVQHDESNVRVLVARADIPAGTPADKAAGMLKAVEVAHRNLVPGAISSRNEIEGITSDAIFAGEQVTTLRFRPVTQVGVRADLKGNQRAFQLAGDVNQLLIGTLKPGDRVDVVALVKYQIRQITGRNDDEVGDIERVASRVVLRDLRVLKVSDEAVAAKVTGTGVAGWVQLAVTDSQAQKLIFVTKTDESSDWSLQLRPVVDATDSPESVETIESVLADGLKPRQILQLAGGGR